MEEKDYRRKCEIEDEIREISQDRDKLHALKRDVQNAEERFFEGDRSTLDLCNEIEETLIYNGDRTYTEFIFAEQREWLSKSMGERRDFICDEIGRLDQRLRQLDEKEEELEKEKRSIDNKR